MEPSPHKSIGQAVSEYVDQVRGKSIQHRVQQELFKFTKWFGLERSISGLSPFEIGEYSEKLGSGGAVIGVAEHVKDVRKFLVFARENGLIEKKLSNHLKAPKARSHVGARASATELEKTEITLDGHSKLEKELEELKSNRVPIAKQIQRAAADKDVRENAPLEAAREQLGHLEARIRQIETTLASAVIVELSGKRLKGIGVGSKVVLRDLESGQEKVYQLVGAMESNPFEGKISDVSPVGKALVSASVGQKVEVQTPRGKQTYQILKVLG